MNIGRKTKQLRKYILKHANISMEFKRNPDINYPPYRKGSYEVRYLTKDGEYGGTTGDINKYEAYKSIANGIEKYIKSI